MLVVTNVRISSLLCLVSTELQYVNIFSLLNMLAMSHVVIEAMLVYSAFWCHVRIKPFLENIALFASKY